MRQAYDSVPRWRDRPSGGVSDEERASLLTRDSLAGLPDGLSDLQLARIEQRMKAIQPTRPAWGLRLALAAVLLVAAAASVMAIQAGWLTRQVAKDEASPIPRAGHEARTAHLPERAPALNDTPRLAEEPSAVGAATVSNALAHPPSRPEPAPPSPVAAQPATAPGPAAATDRILPGRMEAPAGAGSEARPAIAQPAPAGNSSTPIALMPFPAAAPSPLTERAGPVPQSEPEGRSESKAGTAVAAQTSRMARQAASSRPDPQAGDGYAEPTSGSPELIRASQEILALDHALGLLRREHDAQGALLALDEYLARFPAGLLGYEARVARVDALLVLKRSDEALLALEALPLDQHRRSAELQVIRAELRSRSDCVLAERDFTAVLARVRSPTLEERALYGRASCLGKHGDSKGATEDARRYLERFPKGTHAAWARRWLESIKN